LGSKELRVAEPRATAKRTRELEAKAATTEQTETKPVTLGAKPKLEDHDYDADKFEDLHWQTWFERKRQADTEARAKQEAEADAISRKQTWQAQAGWLQQGESRAYECKDFEDAEATWPRYYSTSPSKA
jgi:hypothetical protein